jgi:hypothetical protein
MRKSTADKPLKDSDYLWVSSEVIGQTDDATGKPFAEVVYASADNDAQLQPSALQSLSEQNPQQLVDRSIIASNK